MKKKAAIIGVMVILALTVGLVAQQPATKIGDSHLGTWQLVSTKYGDAREFSDYPKERQRLKMITATHFTWVDYEMTTKQISSSAEARITCETTGTPRRSSLSAPEWRHTLVSSRISQ